MAAEEVGPTRMIRAQQTWQERQKKKTDKDENAIMDRLDGM